MYSPVFLIISIIFSIIFTYLSLTRKKTAFQIVNQMDFGWTLGNSFESYDSSIKIKTPIEQITLWGNEPPKKESFKKLKKYGFKTIRFPVTWMNFMDELGNVDPKWMTSVKEVVDMIISSDLYCILNVHHDSNSGFWLSEGEKAKKKFIILWKQISNEFILYDDHLIFECMNDVVYDGNYNYSLLLLFNQAFIDTIRNSGGNNKDRLLIIAGANKELDLTCSKDYLLPNDPSNKFAISIHYFLPSQFAVEKDDDPWFYFNSDGKKEIIEPMTQWGTENDYKEMFTNFETMKKSFVDKGIPIIITEVGVYTEQKKETESIEEYLFFFFSLSNSYNGISSCLIDKSNKEFGDMNFYDRKNYKWFDEKIGINFKNIYRKNTIKPTDYYFISKKETVKYNTPVQSIIIRTGSKKVINAIYNVKILSTYSYEVGFGVASVDKNGKWFGIKILGQNGNKEYDGTYTYNIDLSNEDINNYVEIQKWWGNDYIIFNNFSIEYNQTYKFFDYEAYKSEL